MKKLFLIDGHSILNRAYYGLPDFTNGKGQHTGAVYGFLNMMTRFLDAEKPDYFAVAFDMSAPTFRHRMYAAYKGTRHPMDPELKSQVPLIQEMLKAMRIPVITAEGYEADDILGTLSRRGEEAGLTVTVMSGDRDLLQLATDQVKILIPKTKKTGTEIEEYHAADVRRTKGVTPQEFIDVKALMGDQSDNIPGVPSIGEKTATAIIQTYHSIENAHEHAAEIRPKRASENLVTYWDQAVLSKELATIDTDVPLDFDLSEAAVHDIYTEDAYRLCKELEFRNMLPRFQHTKEEPKGTADLAAADHDGLLAMLKEASEKETVGLSVLIWDKKPVSIGISDGRRACGGSADGIDICRIVTDLLGQGKRIAFPDLKPVLHLFSVQEIPDYSRFFDTSVAAYLLNPLKNDYPMAEVAGEYLGLVLPSREDRFGKKKEQEIFTAEDPETKEALMLYAAGEALTAAKAAPVLNGKLREEGMEKLYREVEIPLVFTLSDMEKAGMRMDAAELQAYGKKLSAEIGTIEERIYDAAGEKFNINSPKQLGQILFKKMQIPNSKKTKTGWSTSAEVLNELAPSYPIVSDILLYRQYTKLLSTYVEGLKTCVASDGRVHSTFQQKVTATGRISSADPNLQNIPVRMELGKQIRKVFYPEEGYVYLDADYSQIELRVLAALSGDENMIEAYREGRDIHRATAARVFHVPFDEVTDLQRRNAKAVNFGIVYGISPFGLAKDIHVSRAEAKAYIDSYYEAFPALKSYLEGLVGTAKEKGYSETLFGRRRPIPELRSSNFMTRQFGERVARNAPVQGTAADIIKIAMVRVHDRLLKEHLSSRLVLQVHDELLIEAKKEELPTVRDILREEMEGAADLDVKLEVDMHEGANWYDAK